MGEVPPVRPCSELRTRGAVGGGKVERVGVCVCVCVCVCEGPVGLRMQRAAKALLQHFDIIFALLGYLADKKTHPPRTLP